MIAEATDLWVHQIAALDGVNSAINHGFRRILVTSPTGGGKTRIMQELIDDWLHEGKKVSLYTNRKLLLDQTSRVMSRAGIRHGIRAADYEREAHHNLQISSVQTEASRVLKRQTWALHESDRIIIDEAHIQAGDAMRVLIGRHLERPGAVAVGFTATPLDLRDVYDCLVVAGTTSQLRACGALVPALHYGCDEPDMRLIKKVPVGEDLSEGDVKKLIMRPGIFGRVLDWWRKLNPDQKPTIGFAPDVASAIWFCEQFAEAGIRCAAIDGKNCWIDGETQPTSPQLRKEILDGSRDGSIKIIWNRFVLREGIDCPWLTHGILATVFGSLQSYLQSGGRLLRAFLAGDKDKAVIQDHGGNWWRHGSLNMDRVWNLDDTARIVSGLREDGLRNLAAEGRCAEPIRCPQCGMVRAFGPKCAHCGHVCSARSRLVVQADGSLKEHKGEVYKPRVTAMKPNTQQLWTKTYFRAKNSKKGMTFKQAEGLFFSDNFYWPPHTLHYMPTRALDWFLAVKDVPKERLQ